MVIKDHKIQDGRSRFEINKYTLLIIALILSRKTNLKFYVYS